MYHIQTFFGFLYFFYIYKAPKLPPYKNARTYCPTYFKEMGKYLRCATIQCPSLMYNDC